MNTYYKCRTLREYELTLRVLFSEGYTWGSGRTLEDYLGNFEADSLAEGYAIIIASSIKVLYREDGWKSNVLGVCLTIHPSLLIFKKPSIFRSSHEFT